MRARAGALHSNRSSRYKQTISPSPSRAWELWPVVILSAEVNQTFFLMLKVEGCPSGESPATPRKRLHSAEDARCSSRPPPEGAGSVSISESEEKGGFCQQCQQKVTELKKQALALADQNSLKVGLIAFFHTLIGQSHVQIQLLRNYSHRKVWIIIAVISWDALLFSHRTWALAVTCL